MDHNSIAVHITRNDCDGF